VLHKFAENHCEVLIGAIDHRISPQYHPYYLCVTFEDEPGFVYNYHVDGKGRIRQSGYEVSEAKAHSKGNYIEEDDHEKGV
jgi:hypothetical protein